MSALSLLVVLAAIAVLGFFLGRQRALASAGGEIRQLHSLPGHYGWHVVVMALVPSLLALALWMIVQPLVIEGQLRDLFPPEVVASEADRTLLMADVRRVAAGLDTAVWVGALSEDEIDDLGADTGELRALLGGVGVALAGDITPEVLVAARDYRALAAWGLAGRTVVVLALAILGAAYALAVTHRELRARNRVERVVRLLLAGASTIAILTTVGIVLSMLTESLRFFSLHSWTDFFFGTVWNPNFRGNSDLGLLPLLWGTLYITVISMLVAVPIGLFAAIYLAEYASARTRAWVKPMIEVIAGIPTVVFGLFALVYVGPALRDWFAEPLGLGSSGSSVMTAGLVIGILNIPFISSLADDIINAVPQSLRDGSYGLGATRSETIRQVVLPAALPGIMGAVLMAGSRAIGETMIVVMGAGAAAQMSLNPFEAMTTITVKIVSQLTGDTEFNSPETLVAFALGITLFVITLALNILAVWIVRRYREQYE
jgi:phosphate transport system permease protein